jgi:hypothetical protein
MRPWTELSSGCRSLNDGEREQLLDLAEQLADPDLGAEERIKLVDRMRQVLNPNGLPEKEKPTEQENGSRPRGPPKPSPALSIYNLAWIWQLVKIAVHIFWAFSVAALL